MEKYYISLFDKEKRIKSDRVPLKEVIYNQNEIEFEFGEYGTEEYATLPYNDFLFWQGDYEVCLEYDEINEGSDKQWV